MSGEEIAWTIAMAVYGIFLVVLWQLGILGVT
jgi:hypothetical protein